MDRISTFGNTDYLLQQTNRLQVTYAAKQLESSSGLKSETYTGIASDSNDVLNMESLYSRITSQVENAQNAQNTLNTMTDSLNSTSTLLSNMMTTLSTAMGGNMAGSSANTSSQATQALQALAGVLNTKYDNNYIFGGAVTNTAPVNLSAPGYNPAASPTTANTAYYQGDSYVKNINAADSLNVQYGITANNPAFEQALRALSAVVANPTDPTTLQNAYDLIKSSYSDVANLQGETASKSSLLNQQISDHTAELDQIDSSISDKKNADLATVSVQLTETQTQLEASYQTLTKLLSLNLYSFLK